MENTEIVKVIESSGVDKSTAEVHFARFAPFMSRFSELAESAKNIETENPCPEDAAAAREIRLALVKIRTSAEKEKDDAKRGLLNETNLIQSLYNVVKNTCQIEEARMDAVEKYLLIKKQREEAELRAVRMDELQAFQPVDLTGIDLGKMPEATWINFIAGAKAIHAERERKAKEAAEEAARQAELERMKLFKANRETQRTMKLAAYGYSATVSDGLFDMSDEDFQVLYAKAESRFNAEKLIRELELKRTAELAQYGGAGHDLGRMDESEYAILIESFRTKHQAIIQRQKMEREAAERKAAEERAERERIEAENRRIQAELKAKQDAEDAARKQAEREAKRLAAAPDKAKIKSFYDALMALPMPDCTTDAGKSLASIIEAQRNKFADWVAGQIESI